MDWGPVMRTGPQLHQVRSHCACWNSTNVTVLASNSLAKAENFETAPVWASVVQFLDQDVAFNCCHFLNAETKASDTEIPPALHC